jgi:peptidoglycan/xylan/chitin deacetylase (PgdA/CDA1 family)
MNWGKKLARNYLFPSILLFKGEQVLRFLSRNSILNLVYHGVVENDSNYFSPRHMQRDMFDRQMRYISENFNVIGLTEAFDLYRNNIIPERKTITISFDDGYLNNLKIALPVLEKYNIKTTFFISGVCAEESNIPLLWADIIAALKFFNKDVTTAIGERSFYNLTDADTGEYLPDLIKRMGVIERDILLNVICSKFNIEEKLKSIPWEIWKLMNKNDVRQLSLSPCAEIGSHGYFHYNYNFIPLADSVNDMIRSKQVLEHATGKEINMIAYPDGGYNADVKSRASEIGFFNQLAVNYLHENDFKDKCILNRHGVSASTNYASGIFYMNRAFINKAFN